MEKDDDAFDERNIGKSLMDFSVNIISVATNLTSIISAQNTMGVALLNLLTKNNHMTLKRTQLYTQMGSPEIMGE